MRRDEILLLVDYNRWATPRVLRQAASLSQREPTRPTWLSHQTLLRSFIHMDSDLFFASRGRRTARRTQRPNARRTSPDSKPAS